LDRTPDRVYLDLFDTQGVLTMGWRKLVHKVTGRCMTRYVEMERDEWVIGIWSKPDGDAVGGAQLSRNGELLEVVLAEDESVTQKVEEWINRVAAE
jgi:hypothetical protein